MTVSPASPAALPPPPARPQSRWAPATHARRITDTATLSGGYSPTGTITFTLTGPGSFVFTQTDTVNGNVAYSASTTLPTTGTVVGVYQWAAVYNGDGNNNTASDGAPTQEQVQGSWQPRPTLGTGTNASPRALTLPAPVPTTLSDTATLSGAFSATGNVVFTLSGPGGFVFHHDRHGQRQRRLRPARRCRPRAPWRAHIPGRPTTAATTTTSPPATRAARTSENNCPVSQASPTLTTTPSPTTATLGDTAPPVLTDSAKLSGGFAPTGTITFQLFHNGGTTPVDTETVTIGGNGTYTTPAGFPLPTTERGRRRPTSGSPFTAA